MLGSASPGAGSSQPLLSAEPKCLTQLLLSSQSAAAGQGRAADQTLQQPSRMRALLSATAATPVTESTPPLQPPSDARRLLIITYASPPDGTVGGLRWAGITKYLTRLGWTVSVLTAAPGVRNDTAVSAHVESCPRLWTFIDFCRLLRRLAFGRSLGAFPEGSRVARPS